MTVTEDHQPGYPFDAVPASSAASAREAVNDMLEAGLLDELMQRVDAGGLTLTGEGGFRPEMIKAVLERGLQTELSEHLGYEKGDPAGRVPMAQEFLAALGRHRHWGRARLDRVPA